MRSLLVYLWASPYTLLGLSVGGVGLMFGGRVRCRSGVVQFCEGPTKRLLHRLRDGQFVLAITLGHVVLGQTEAALDVSHEHELVHVRQYERWGPFFGPAYLLASLWLWFRGRDPYRDNPFEREAYDADPPC